MRLLPLLLLAACATPPPPWQPPQAEWRVEQLADIGATAAAATGEVTVALHAVPTAPTGEPLAGDVQVVTAEQQRPFRGAAPTAGWLRLPDGPLPANSQPVTATTQPVTSNATTRLATGLDGLPALELRRRDDGSLAVAFLVQGHDGAALHVHLRTILTARTVYFVPRLPSAPDGLLFEIVPGTAQPAAATPPAVTTAPAPASQTPTLRDAQLELVARSVGAQNRRGALLALVLRGGDAALIDALVTAEESLLIDASRRVAALPAAADATAADWPLAVTIWGAFADAAQRDALAPGTRACLLRHFGSLALDPFGLGEALADSRDAESFWATVRADNQHALTDLTVHGRVHGHDWLAARQLAVPDYDPLSDDATRRAALRAASGREGPR